MLKRCVANGRGFAVVISMISLDLMLLSSKLSPWHEQSKCCDSNGRFKLCF